MRRLLVHLHPDFQEPLEEIVERWNSVQKKIKFTGLRPSRNNEHVLLTPGEISEAKAAQFADAIRIDAGYPQSNGILVFTEKRLFSDEFYQLFVGGQTRDDDPPDVSILSLHFLRASYLQERTKRPILFRAVLSNILFSIATDIGLPDHGSEVRGCVMDFCEYMPDIEKGLRNGPTFCDKCESKLRSKRAEYILALSTATKDVIDLNAVDEEVTESIVLRGKRNAEINDTFDYDVALSFAGADRSKAERLAKSLREKQLKVFYDTDEQANLWGKNLQLHFSELYRLRAQFCIVLVSESYSKSRWTKVELQAALAREFEREQEFILPIRLDDSEVHGILPVRGYIAWDQHSVEEIADLAAKKISNSRSGK